MSDSTVFDQGAEDATTTSESTSELAAPSTTSTTVAAIRATPVRLPAGDADVYLLAEAILGRRRSERYEHPPDVDAPSPALRLALARTIPVALLRFVETGGGERDARVLRGDVNGPGGRRLIDVALSAGSDLNDDDVASAGDADDADAKDGARDASGGGGGDGGDEANGGDGVVDSRFTLRTSAFPNTIWTLATVALPLFERRRQENTLHLQGLGRTDRARLRQGLAEKARLTGDHLAYAAASHHLHRLGLLPAFHAYLARQLAGASPLAQLWLLDDTDLSALDVDALLRPPLSRCLELLTPLLSDVLVATIRRVVTTSQDRTELRLKMAAVVGTLRRLIAAIDGAQRTDLLAIVVGVAASLHQAVPVETRARLLRLPGVVTMADRDLVVSHVAEVFSIVDDVDAVAATVAAARYGDDRAIEARLLPTVMAPLVTHRDAVDAARRALLASVG